MNNSIEQSMIEAIELINRSDNIYIVSHVQPDGDNIGSSLALALAVKELKGKVNIIKVDDIPSSFMFLPGVDMIEEQDINSPIDLLIVLDSSDLDRLGWGKEFALKANKIINIDHHVTNENFGHINIVSPSSAATAEIVYDFINKMGVSINKDIATCLYTGISTDTGSFIYSNTSYRTHLIASELIKIGIDTDYININLYQNRSMTSAKLFINSLNQLETYLDDRIGLVSINQEMLRQSDAKLEDAEGIISFIRGIDSIEVACILKEIDKEEIKVSLRSKKHIDVSKICNKFNGGGHIRAAGCTIYEEMPKAKELILNEIISSFR